jgi:hypothetical protein
MPLCVPALVDQFLLFIFQFAFDKIGSMTTNTITKERKKQETVAMAELDQRIRRLNSLKMDGQFLNSLLEGCRFGKVNDTASW